MEIGNFSGNPFQRGNFNRNKSQKWREQRMKDIKNNACFKCHKVNCRPNKCSPKEVEASNTESDKRNTGQSEN